MRSAEVLFDPFGDCIQTRLAKYFVRPGSIADADALLEADWSRGWMGWLELSAYLSDINVRFEHDVTTRNISHRCCIRVWWTRR